MPRRAAVFSAAVALWRSVQQRHGRHKTDPGAACSRSQPPAWHANLERAPATHGRPCAQEQWVSAAAPEELQALGLAAPERPVVRLPDSAPIEAKLKAIQARCSLPPPLRPPLYSAHPPPSRTAAPPAGQHQLAAVQLHAHQLLQRLQAPPFPPHHGHLPRHPAGRPAHQVHRGAPLALQLAASDTARRLTAVRLSPGTAASSMSSCRCQPADSVAPRHRPLHRPPHRSLQAAFLGMFLTAGLTELSRFTIGFKSQVDGQVCV